ncbi:MAG: CinA family protein [Coriobacteriaceae bacterium]|nr:CinA family protein [Coriobacteriaceae bacterium]
MAETFGEFHDEIYRLAGRILQVAQERGLTVGCAESCTGGLVAAALTELAGSSAVFKGGLVCYDPQLKVDLLGVDEQIIAEYGVVSCECAEAMAVGARRVTAADVAVSTTGIAGPGGEEPGSPVGTICFGVAGDAGVRSVRRQVEGDARDAIRLNGTVEALTLLLKELA